MKLVPSTLSTKMVRAAKPSRTGAPVARAGSGGSVADDASAVLLQLHLLRRASTTSSDFGAERIDAITDAVRALEHQILRADRPARDVTLADATAARRTIHQALVVVADLLALMTEHTT